LQSLADLRKPSANNKQAWRKKPDPLEAPTNTPINRKPDMTPRIERPIPRRGLSRVEAAMYLGISPSKFDELRKHGRIGPARVLDGRKLYAIEMLDEFFDALPLETDDAVADWTVRL
jgi:hypothetical protein